MNIWSGVETDDTGDVVTAAAVLSISEFEIFRLAYRDWYGHIPEEDTLSALFSRYIQEQRVPMWVRAFTRRVKQLDDEGRLDVRDFGLEPPPPTNARRILVGVAAISAMVAIVSLLVYLMHMAVGPALRGCQLPPCY